MDEAAVRATILIPNWNGEAFIVPCVSSALQAAREHRRITGEEIEVLVVDDASTDRSVERLRRDCPAARLLQRECNGGFAEAVNEGAQAARGELLVLLNSDMAVQPGWLAPLLAPLTEANVFAVTAKTVDWAAGTPNHLNMTARFERGQFVLEYSSPPQACRTLFFQGGCAALRREVFLAAGGFPSLYYPGYWEDYDLSLRAIKAGWRIVYEPRAVAHHLGKASLSARYGDASIRLLSERNRLLFTWTNLSGAGPRMRHWLGLPGGIARDIARGGGAVRLRAFLAAARRWREVAARRRTAPCPARLTDAEACERTRPPEGVPVTTVPGEG